MTEVLNFISRIACKTWLLAAMIALVVPNSVYAADSARASRCDQFLKSLNQYASGSLTNPSRDINETWGVLQNDSLRDLSEFYGDTRSRFAKYDCDMKQGFSKYWPLFVHGHLNAPDALEEKNLNYTNRLIALAFRSADVKAIGEIADIYGSYLLKNIDWANALVRSPQIASVMMERLWLLSEEWKEPKLRHEAMTTLNRRASALLPLYHSLARSRSAQDFLKLIPQGAHTKPKHVHHAARSALKHFLSLSPSPNQIRQLALWMHDYEELFHIQNAALQKVRTPSEFLRVTDYYYKPVNDEYAARVRKFLRPKYNSFLGLSPNSQEIGEFSKRIQESGTDQTVLANALSESKSASELIQTAQSSLGSTEQSRRSMSKILEDYVQKFAQLEPSAEEINSFRLLLGTGIAELQLLRFTLPKMVSGADFVTLARLHGADQERKGDEFSVRVKEILRDHVDMFLAVSPTVHEINAYRQRTFDPKTDEILLKAGLETASSARESLLLATLFGLEPPHSPTAFDEVTTKVLVSKVDAFLVHKPTLAEIQIYRARMANPWADIKLVAAALKLVNSRDDVFGIVSRRPMLRTKAFEKAWSETIERHWPWIKRHLVSKNDRALFLREVPDQSVVARINSLSK